MRFIFEGVGLPLEPKNPCLAMQQARRLKPAAVVSFLEHLGAASSQLPGGRRKTRPPQAASRDARTCRAQPGLVIRKPSAGLSLVTHDKSRRHALVIQ